MPRSLLSNLQIGEIAFCRSGMHPSAKIVLYKRRDGSVKKEEDEPRSFEEHYQSSRLMEIDGAIDRRLHALLATTTEIMRADVDDREDRILAAVAEYATTMQRDVPELFAGRLAKWIKQWAGESRPSEDDVCAIVKSELYGAGLLPDKPKSGGGAMEFLKSLSERGRAALGFVLGNRDPAEFFKGTTEDVGKLVVGLLEKASEWAGRIDSLEADLEKAKKPPPDPTSLESILKSIEDPGVRAYVETQGAAVRNLGGKVTTLEKAARRKDLAEIAKSCECIPNENGALIDALEKADTAGILETIKTVLESANAQARLGKAFEELGIETVIGEGAVGTPEEAHEALVAKATEIRKSEPSLTAEAAYTKACERHGDLYLATRNVPPGVH